MRRFLLPLILFQCVLIIYLAFNFYLNKFKKSFNYISINPIKKESIEFIPYKSMRYFYELSSNHIQYASEFGKVDWLDHQAKYTINDDNLNERNDYTISKPKKTFRIITLGDSFTYGSYVDTEHNWTEMLEDFLNINKVCENIKKFEVINLGVYGYDIQYSYERFKVRGEKYKPDLIIWFIKDDDLNQLNEIMLPKVFEFKKQMEQNGMLEKLQKQGNIYPYWSEAIHNIYKVINRDRIAEKQLVFLEQFNSIYNKKIIIMTFSFTMPSNMNLLKKFSKNKNIYLFNNLNNIYLNKANYYPDSHPNRTGHKLIAQDLFNYLKKNKNIIQCD